MTPWSMERICVPCDQQLLVLALVRVAMANDTELSGLNEWRLRGTLEDLARMQARSWGHGQTKPMFFREMLRYALGKHLYEEEASRFLQNWSLRCGESITDSVLPLALSLRPTLDIPKFKLDLDWLFTLHECAYDGQLDANANLRVTLSLALGARCYERLAISTITACVQAQSLASQP